MKNQALVAFIGVDNESFMMLTLGLEGLLFEEQPIKFYNIRVDEYKEELKRNSFALLIVEMTKEWKRVVKYLRETIKNSDTRVILRSHSNQFKIRELEHYLIGDRLRIKQIFVNLLSNAAKFTHKGYIKYGWHRIDCEDTGV